MAKAEKWRSEFLVHAPSNGAQQMSKIAALKDGGFVAVWWDWDGRSEFFTVKARLFGADGTARGEEFVVADTTANPKLDVAVLNDGRFAVSFLTSSHANARIYNPDGEPTGPAFQVGGVAGNLPSAMTALADGGFVVAYGATGGYIRLQSYASNLQLNGEAIPAGFAPANRAVQVSLAPRQDGSFAVAYERTATLNGNIWNLEGYTLTPGSETLTPLPVAQTGPLSYDTPVLKTLASGPLLFSWRESTSNGGTGTIKAQFLGNDSTTITVAVYSAGQTIDLDDVVALRDGGFAILTSRNSGGGDTDIFLSLYSAAGTPIESDLVVNTTRLGGQKDAAVTEIADGRLAVTWRDGDDVRGQIVDPRQAAVDLAGSYFDDDYYGTKFDDRLAGSAGADKLHGEDGHDQLNGGTNDDTLEGGNGNDTLYGGAGDDTAVFSGSRADYQITYNSDGSVTVFGTDGTDLVKDVKILKFDDSEMSLDNVAPTGLMLSNADIAEDAPSGAVVGTLSATDANGDDIRYSLAAGSSAAFAVRGNSLVVTGTLDFETKPTHQLTVEAKDEFGGSTSLTVTVSVTDAVETTPFTLQGVGGADILTGEAGNDTIYGAGANDILSGEAGDDRLHGGLGNDRLKGGAGKDVFVFDAKTNKSTNVDRIEDFSVKDDGFFLENKIFTKLGSGTFLKPKKFASDMFVKGTKAQDAEDRIIYDKKTGALYYDQDGTGSKAQVKIAMLTKNLALTHADFFVV